MTAQEATLSEHLRAAWRAVGAWDADIAAITRVSVSENIVFRVTDAAGKPFVLRLHRPGYHDYDELVAEQTWTRALVEAGVDAPIAIPTRGGKGYARVTVGGEQRYVGMLAWVEGETLGDAIAKRLRDHRAKQDAEQALRRHFAALGQLMAAVHNQASDWDVPEGFSRHAFDADGFVGEQPFWGRFWESPHLNASQRRNLEGLRRPIHDILSAYGKERGTYSLIHADLHPDNIIVNGARLHIIDFDDAGFGWHPYEFAVALYNYQHDVRFDALRDALVNGYRRLRPIADEAVELVPLFLLVRSLASIGWVAARPELRHGERTAWLMRQVEDTSDSVLARY